MCTNVDPNNIPWSYKQELKGVKKWGHAQSKVNDVTYKEVEEIPANIEKLMFPNMTAKRPLWSMDEARAIVNELNQLARPISKPRLPDSIWVVRCYQLQCL